MLNLKYPPVDPKYMMIPLEMQSMEVSGKINQFHDLRENINMTLHIKLLLPVMMLKYLKNYK